MALAILAVIVYGVVHAVSGGSHHVNTAARQKPVPATSSAAKPSHTPSPSPTPTRRSVVVQLAANEDCWVGVYSPDGVMQSQVYIPGGSERSWRFTHQVAMKIGNPGGIVLTVNGHRITDLGTNAVTLDLKPGGHTVTG